MGTAPTPSCNVGFGAAPTYVGVRPMLPGHGEACPMGRARNAQCLDYTDKVGYCVPVWWWTGGSDLRYRRYCTGPVFLGTGISGGRCLWALGCFYGRAGAKQG